MHCLTSRIHTFIIEMAAQNPNTTSTEPKQHVIYLDWHVDDTSVYVLMSKSPFKMDPVGEMWWRDNQTKF